MRFIILPALAASLLTGCIVYDEELVFEDDTAAPATPDNDRPDRPDDPTTGSELLDMEPRKAAPGDVFIASIYSETNDLAAADEITFYGPSDLEILTTQVRDGEILATLSVACDSPAGDNDLLVAFGDGSALFLEAALTVDPLPCN